MSNTESYSPNKASSPSVSVTTGLTFTECSPSMFEMPGRAEKGWRALG